MHSPRLYACDDNGNTYFYWSQTPGQFGAYIGPNSDHVWGKLTHENHMKATNRAFIADLAMVRKLESHKKIRPCARCQSAEYKRWKAER